MGSRNQVGNEVWECGPGTRLHVLTVESVTATAVMIFCLSLFLAL